MAMKRTVHRILGTAAVSAIALAGVACGTTSDSAELVSTKTDVGLSFGSADSAERHVSDLSANATAADSARLTAAAAAARVGYVVGGSADSLEHNATSSSTVKIPFRNLDTD